MVVDSKLIIQSNRFHKPMKCHYDICGVFEHMTMDCPRFNEMRNIFKNKSIKLVESQQKDTNYIVQHGRSGYM
jgi:hypothetical protein